LTAVLRDPRMSRDPRRSERVVPAMLARLPGLEPGPQPPVRRDTVTLRGLASLPVTFRAPG